MAKYAVRYTETLARTVIVEADNPDDAIEMVMEQGGIELDYDDFDGRDAIISPDANTDGTATDNQIALCEKWEPNYSTAEHVVSNSIKRIGGFNIFEVKYDEYKGKNEISYLVSEGMCFRFSEWLKNCGYDDDVEPMDIYNNTSPIRDGNRLDIIDNYEFEDGLEIAYLYSINMTVWAGLYDPSKDAYVGEIEITPV